jgi:CheY-like chemotaxis protein
MSAFPVKLRVLVADDNRDAAAALAALIRTREHEVRVADNGRSALEIAIEFEPHIGIFDIGMPGLTGYELASYIREQPWARHVVLIAVSGWKGSDDREKAWKAGFSHHIGKPADPDVLLDFLARTFPANAFDVRRPGVSEFAHRALGIVGLERLWPGAGPVNTQAPHGDDDNVA